MLRWKKEPRKTGLHSIGAGPRGSRLHDGEKTYARVFALGGNWEESFRGWFWVAGWDSDIPRINTYKTPCETEEEAKKLAKEYVLKHIQEDSEQKGENNETN